MWRRPRFLSRESGLEEALKAQRSEAPEEFVARLSKQIEEARPRQPVAWSRLAFAGAVSTLILGTFASFGGFGVAASGASGTYKLAKELVVDQRVSVDRSSAADQYGPTPTAPEQNVGGTESEGTAEALGAEAQGTLPFTGISLLATVIVGFALLGTGLFLRRRERQQT